MFFFFSSEARVLILLHRKIQLRSESVKTKTVEFANSVDPDEAAHYEPPHLGLHCLLSNLYILNIIWLG